MPAASKNVTFTGSQGGDLAAHLDVPDGPLRACTVFALCFTCSRDNWAAARIARALATSGIGVLRVDFTGPRASDGDLDTGPSPYDLLLVGSARARR